jgi:hypothetical protein
LTVAPTDSGETAVTITTEMTSRAGVPAFLARRFLSTIYARELALLASVSENTTVS